VAAVFTGPPAEEKLRAGATPVAAVVLFDCPNENPDVLAGVVVPVPPKLKPPPQIQQHPFQN